MRSDGAGDASHDGSELSGLPLYRVPKQHGGDARRTGGARCGFQGLLRCRDEAVIRVECFVDGGRLHKSFSDVHGQIAPHPTNDVCKIDGRIGVGHGRS
ncbi:hypothetical protein SAMN04490244_107201 [Tranquillimonas rosea]|uniref:Uncharacterized protein n=1 Tax=Tranquillimonas rosea TaxID=641238 RepID=A0A1H9VLV1_9RHOB|nr:hypothetical protein SAMN04490244_107201 [Tranquillimonas rosea]